MIISTPVSLGELVDKIAILHIKNINIKDENKLTLVREEMEMLNKTLYENVKRDDIKNYLNTLIEINSQLWSIEDNIRDCERNKIFDQKFRLSRQI